MYSEEDTNSDIQVQGFSGISKNHKDMQLFFREITAVPCWEKHLLMNVSIRTPVSETALQARLFLKSI